MITPNDLLNRKFEKAKVGGYKTNDVDSFMVEAASLFSQQSREIAELKRKLDGTHTKLAEYEKDQDSLREALLSAQRLADNIVRDAKSKAELYIRDAEIKAGKIIEKADNEIESQQGELVRIKKEVADFRSNLMKIYRAHLELINELPVQPAEETQSEEDDSVQEISGQSGDDSNDSQRQAEKEAAAAVVDIPPDSGLHESKANGEDIPKNETKTAADGDVPKPQQDVNVKLKVKYDEKSGEYVPFTTRLDDNGQKH